MRHPMGSCVTIAREAWQVVAVLSGTRQLLSLNGKRTRYAAAVRLTPAP